MNIEQAEKFLIKLLLKNVNSNSEYKLTPMLWGPPGIGKSAIVKKAVATVIAETGKNYTLKDLRLSTMAPVDVRGVPALPNNPDAEDARFKFVPPEFLPKDGEHTLLFFDEVNTAPPSNQVVAYEIALDYRLGGHPLPKGTLVVLAGNRTEDKGATYEMPLPLANRLVHINVEPDVDSFFKYGLEKGIHHSILGFLKFRPSLLHVMPSGKQKAFPTPRSWEFASILLGEEETPSINVEELSGIIGEGAASEFHAFVKLYKHLPNIDDILEKGGTFKHQEDSVNYAFLTALVQKYLQKPTEKRANNMITAIAELPEELQAMGIYMCKAGKGNALMHVVKAKDFPRIRDAVRSVVS